MKRLTVMKIEASSERGFARAVALLVDELELHVFEYIDSSLSKTSYAYHLQDRNGGLIFRYNNEPHYPELPTFPHHRHISDSPSPEASRLVSVEEVLAEAAAYIAGLEEEI